MQHSQEFRSPFQILSTKGYVTAIEGDAGIGKTSLALAASLLSGSAVKYISYNEPESSLIEKAKRVARKEPENLEVLRMLSGSKEAFSEIISSLNEGKVVILDSVDAFMLSFDERQSRRALLQLVYEAAKARNGSLILISEGVSEAPNVLKFVADAYIKMEYANLLGLNARRITIVKDRDYPVSVYPFYLTFYGGLQIFESSYSTDLETITQKRVKMWERPWGERSVLREPGLILYTIDDSVSVQFSRVYRLWLAADYLNRGYSVIFMARPDEEVGKLKGSIETMSGKSEGFTVLKSSGSFVEDYRAIESYKNTLLIADILPWENDAIAEPSSYEFAIKGLVEHNVTSGSGAFLFAYSSYSGLRIVSKYAVRERRLVETGHHIFLRTVKAPGALYIVRVESLDTPELKLIMMY